VIDLHFHVLPGIDDGPASLAETMGLIRAADAVGTTTIVATPHVSSRYRNDSRTIARVAQEVNLRCLDEGLGVRVLNGAEIAMPRAAELPGDELTALTLAGAGWLLIESPFVPVTTGMSALLDRLQRQGYNVVLAHPERCPAFHREPVLLASLARAGVLNSITAGSLVGQFGDRVRRFSLELASAGLIHNVASDAHDLVQRTPAGLAELEQVGLSPLADWLTRDVPAAVLTGRPIPPRPAVAMKPPHSLGRRRWPRRR